jgi:tetratricopeptide (TPR) repeat protein
MKEKELSPEEKKQYRELLNSIKEDLNNNKKIEAESKLNGIKDNQKYRDCVEHRYWFGVFYILNKDYEKAINELNGIISEKDKNFCKCLPEDGLEKFLALVLHDLGSAYYLQGDYSAAEKNYKLALEKNGKNPEYLNDLGEAYSKLKKYKEAQDSFLKALNENSNNGYFEYKLGGNYYDWGLLDEAETSFNKAFEIYSRKFRDEQDNVKKANLELMQAAILVDIAKVQIIQSRNEVAEINLKSALNIYNSRESYINNLLPIMRSNVNENISALHNNLGVIYYKKNSYAEAINEFKEALKRNPNSARSYNNLANVHAKKGDKDTAEKLYNEALKIKPLAAAHINLKLIKETQAKTAISWWDWWFNKRDTKAALGIMLFLVLFLLIASILAQSWLFKEITTVSTIVEPQPTSLQKYFNKTEINKSETIQNRTNITNSSTEETTSTTLLKTETTTEKKSPATPEIKLLFAALVVLLIILPQVRGFSAGQVKFDLELISEVKGATSLEFILDE